MAFLRTRTRLALGLAVALASWAAARLFFVVVYQSNDDVVMEMLARGVGIARQPTPHLLFINIVVGRALTWLYRELPGIAWYRVVTTSVQVAATVAVGFTALGVLSAGRVLLLASYVVVFDFHAHVHPHFTVTAAMAAQAAVLLWVERAVGGRDMGAARWLSFLALVLASTLVRVEACLLIGAAAAPAVAYLAVRLALAQRGGSVPAFAGAVAPFIAGVLLAAAAKAYNDREYARAPGWQGFYEFNTLRAQLTDYGRAPFGPGTKAVYDEVGWSANDDLMLRRWLFADRQRYSVPKLRRILDSSPPGDPHSALFMALGLVRLAEEHPPLRMMTVAAFLPLFITSRHSAVVAVLGLAGAVVVGVLLVTFLLRCPPSVYAVLLGFAAALPLALPTRAIRCAARRPGTWLQLGWPVLTAALAAESVAQLRFEAALTTGMHERLTRALATLRPRPDQLYVVWGGCYPFEMLLGEADFQSLRALKMLATGFCCQSPVSDARLAEFGITDLYRAMWERPDVFVIGGPELNDLFANYVREHYGKRVVARTVLRVRLADGGRYDFATRQFRPEPNELQVYQFQEVPAPAAAPSGPRGQRVAGRRRLAVPLVGRRACRHGLQGLPLHVLRLAIDVQVQPAEVFANDPQRHELHAAQHQDGDNRRGVARLVDLVAQRLDQVVEREQDSAPGRGEAAQRYQLQRQEREVREQVEGQHHQLAERVARAAVGTLVVGDRHLPDALRVPGEQAVDEREIERVRKRAQQEFPPDRPERADNHVRAEDQPVEARHQRRAEVAERMVPLVFVEAVDQVQLPGLERLEQLRDLLGRVLAVVVHGHDEPAARPAEARHEGVVLPVVPHELHGHDPRRPADVELPQDLPGVVPAAVVDKDHLVGHPRPVEHRLDALQEPNEPLAGVVHGNNNGQVHANSYGARPHVRS